MYFGSNTSQISWDQVVPTSVWQLFFYQQSKQVWDQEKPAGVVGRILYHSCLIQDLNCAKVLVFFCCAFSFHVTMWVKGLDCRLASSPIKKPCPSDADQHRLAESCKASSSGWEHMLIYKYCSFCFIYILKFHSSNHFTSIYSLHHLLPLRNVLFQGCQSTFNGFIAWSVHKNSSVSVEQLSSPSEGWIFFTPSSPFNCRRINKCKASPAIDRTFATSAPSASLQKKKGDSQVKNPTLHGNSLLPVANHCANSCH